MSIFLIFKSYRKNEFKEYVVIIDFIGNYNNNFLIPIALSGDRSFNKDTIRKYVLEGTRVMPGCSTINFDEISKKKIFESIDQAKFNDIKLIKESYNNLKQKIGRIPTLNDSQELFVEFISKKLASGKRVHELILLKNAIEGKSNLIQSLNQELKENYNIEFKDTIETNIVNIFINEFLTGSGKKTC